MVVFLENLKIKGIVSQLSFNNLFDINIRKRINKAINYIKLMSGEN